MTYSINEKYGILTFFHLKLKMDYDLSLSFKISNFAINFEDPPL